MNDLSLYSQPGIEFIRVSKVFANRVQLNLIKIPGTRQTLLTVDEFKTPGVNETEIILDLGALTLVI